MEREKAIKVMREAFAKLPTEYKENLVYHAKKGTTILCQENADRYLLGNGAWPAGLATTRVVDEEDFNEELADGALSRMESGCFLDSEYRAALQTLTEDEIRILMFELESKAESKQNGFEWL